MSEKPRFEPLLPAHAIERCAATVVFASPLPANAVQQAVRAAAAEIAEWSQLQPAQSVGVAITFDTKTGKVSLTQPANSFTYELGPDGSQLSVMPNIVIWQTSKYVRWKPFSGQFSTFAAPIVERFLEHAAINAVKLEYWDRFVWTGLQTDMDPALLLRENLRLVAPFVVQKGKVWHSHCGWFEPGPAGCRRLTNVNVDVVDVAVRPNEPLRPTIGIYTMLQDDHSVGGATRINEVVSVSSKLHGLHSALKALLDSIISEEMAERISLRVGDI